MRKSFYFFWVALIVDDVHMMCIILNILLVDLREILNRVGGGGLHIVLVERHDDSGIVAHRERE